MPGAADEVPQYGRNGQVISDFLPWHAKMADDICIVRSMVTEQINHDPAHTFMNTGTAISGRPSMGSWINYGLGSECDDLPGFVVLTSVGGRNPQPIASRQWSAGFLPSRFQGVEFNSSGDPVHYVRNPAGVYPRSAAAAGRCDSAAQSASQPAAVDNPEIDTRIAAYEMAFRMQTSVPELMDMSDEPQQRSRTCTEPSRATVPTPPTACWHDAWPSAVCGSSICITAVGTITADWSST